MLYSEVGGDSVGHNCMNYAYNERIKLKPLNLMIIAMEEVGGGYVACVPYSLTVDPLLISYVLTSLVRNSIWFRERTKY